MRALWDRLKTWVKEYDSYEDDVNGYEWDNSLRRFRLVIRDKEAFYKKYKKQFDAANRLARILEEKKKHEK